MDEPIKIYWSDCANRGYNAGDEWAGRIVEEITGRKTVRVLPHESEIITVGSILHHMPGDYSGFVFGSGFIADWNDTQLPYAKVTALRGKLTARRMRRDVPLGDPLLLINKPRYIEPKYELGILMHYADWDDPVYSVEIWKLARTNPSILVIDICARDVVERIASCKRIITSSLHGLVISDALGIPNYWTIFSEGKIAGGSFKFRDYYSVFNIDDPIPYRYDKVQTFEWIIKNFDYNVDPTPKNIEVIRHDLLEAFPQELRDFREWGTWEERTNIIASLIAPNSSVLDFGSGQQLLKMRLKDCEYQPCDMRTDEGQLFCDFNFGVFPKVEKKYDYVVCAGILEYMNDPREFIRKTMEMGNCIILSYAVKTLDQTIESRTKSGWVNHLTQVNLEDMLADMKMRFVLKEKWEDQIIGYVVFE